MNILVVGNGFDLAHGLPTKYTDFLKFVQIIRQIISMQNGLELSNVDWKDINPQLKDLIKNNICNVKGNLFSQERIWKELLDNNFWIDYFLQCPMYQKENWIDFENEISKIIKTLDKARRLIVKEQDVNSILDSRKIIIREILEVAKKRANDILGSVGKIDKFIGILERDLKRLIRALEIYLLDYVEKIECNIISPDIENIQFCKVLSFNYTNTFTKLYDTKESAKYDYIHGRADSKHTIDTNNMILGIDEYLTKKRKNKETSFIAFKKFYQRIYKGTGCKYKNWTEDICLDKSGKELKTGYDENGQKVLVNKPVPNHNIYIFGHSLDVTDKDILRDLILQDNIYTTIFYLNKEVMGQQIANLVKVIGQDELIKRTGGSKKTIEFKSQQDMVERRQ